MSHILQPKIYCGYLDLVTTLTATSNNIDQLNKTDFFKHNIQGFESNLSVLSNIAHSNIKESPEAFFDNVYDKFMRDTMSTQNDEVLAIALSLLKK